MAKQYSISQARANLPTLVHAVEEGTPVELTRRGQPVAVLMSRRDYRALQRDRVDVWSAIERFRTETDLEALAADDVWEDVRDRSPGRDVEL